MSKVKKTAKATRSEKLVPEKEAFECLCQFAGKVIGGNRITRNMMGDYLDSIEDHEFSITCMKCIIMLVVQDEDQREDFRKEFEDMPEGMELYNLAMDIREVLGLNAFDDFAAENA